MSFCHSVCHDFLSVDSLSLTLGAVQAIIMPGCAAEQPWIVAVGVLFTHAVASSCP